MADFAIATLHRAGSQLYRVSIRLISVRIICNNWRYKQPDGTNDRGTNDQASIELIEHYIFVIVRNSFVTSI